MRWISTRLLVLVSNYIFFLGFTPFGVGPFFMHRNEVLMSGFVEAFSKSTGKKQIIPEAWLELDYPPFDDYTLTPKSRTSRSEATTKEAK